MNVRDRADFDEPTLRAAQKRGFRIAHAGDYIITEISTGRTVLTCKSWAEVQEWVRSLAHAPGANESGN